MLLSTSSSITVHLVMKAWKVYWKTFFQLKRRVTLIVAIHSLALYRVAGKSSKHLHLLFLLINESYQHTTFIYPHGSEKLKEI